MFVKSNSILIKTALIQQERHDHVRSYKNGYDLTYVLMYVRYYRKRIRSDKI